jgi:hypothetical protein
LRRVAAAAAAAAAVMITVFVVNSLQSPDLRGPDLVDTTPTLADVAEPEPDPEPASGGLERIAPGDERLFDSADWLERVPGEFGPSRYSLTGQPAADGYR